ncbi:MAG: hypothetical protein ACI9N9_002050 [Enterobacterales bacterium]|jgi:hypothetical protein
MIKQISFAVVATSWFIFAGVLFSEKSQAIDWLGGLFLYLIGLQWIYGFLLSKTMYTTYTDMPMEANNEKHRGLRLLFFCLGLILCYMGSFSGSLDS